MVLNDYCNTITLDVAIILEPNNNKGELSPPFEMTLESLLH